MNISNHRPIIAAAMTAGLCCWLLTACSSDKPTVSSDPTGAGDQRTAPNESWPSAADCDLMPGIPIRGGDLVLAFGDAVDPAHAPVPENAAERTVFANLYETLTRVGCSGELEPGLAESWQRRDEGRRWRLRLRAGAVFWDGTPVNAGHVVVAWRRNEDLARALGLPCPGLWIASTSRGIAVIDERTIEIRLAEPQEHLPRLLAHPALAVVLRQDGWLWPVGSGPCRLAADTDLPLPDLVCRPNQHHPDTPAWESLTFRLQADSDPRDLLTAGVDLALIRDRDAAAYYAEIDGVESAPLPWNEILVLLTPPGSDLPPDVATLAAAGAVPPAESRPWSRLDFHGCPRATCPQLHGPTIGMASTLLDPDRAALAVNNRRLYHPAGDADSRALVERMLAFVEIDVVAQPATGPDLAAALQTGDAAGYVVRLDACYPSACLTLAALLARADWLQIDVEDLDDPCDAADRLAAAGLAVPVAQTRPRMVWQGPLVGLQLAHDGALLVAGLGRAPLEASP